MKEGRKKWMDGWMDGWMDRCIDGIHESMGGWFVCMYVWMDEMECVWISWWMY